jgi:hypothetical protein
MATKAYKKSEENMSNSAGTEYPQISLEQIEYSH